MGTALVIGHDGIGGTAVAAAVQIAGDRIEQNVGSGGVGITDGTGGLRQDNTLVGQKGIGVAGLDHHLIGTVGQSGGVGASGGLAQGIDLGGVTNVAQTQGSICVIGQTAQVGQSTAFDDTVFKHGVLPHFDGGSEGDGNGGERRSVDNGAVGTHIAGNSQNLRRPARKAVGMGIGGRTIGGTAGILGDCIIGEGLRFQNGSVVVFPDDGVGTGGLSKCRRVGDVSSDQTDGRRPTDKGIGFRIGGCLGRSAAIVGGGGAVGDIFVLFQFCSVPVDPDNGVVIGSITGISIHDEAVCIIGLHFHRVGSVDHIAALGQSPAGKGVTNFSRDRIIGQGAALQGLVGAQKGAVLIIPVDGDHRHQRKAGIVGHVTGNGEGMVQGVDGLSGHGGFGGSPAAEDIAFGFGGAAGGGVAVVGDSTIVL